MVRTAVLAPEQAFLDSRLQPGAWKPSWRRAAKSHPYCMLRPSAASSQHWVTLGLGFGMLHVQRPEADVVTLQGHACAPHQKPDPDQVSQWIQRAVCGRTPHNGCELAAPCHQGFQAAWSQKYYSGALWPIQWSEPSRPAEAALSALPDWHPFDVFLANVVKNLDA